MKLTAKQEKFCQLYVELGNASEAYRQSYSADNMTSKTVTEKACILLAKGNIRAMVEELQAEHKARHNITVDDLIAELQEAQDLAKELIQPNVMIQAIMSKAKLLGMDKQVVEHLDPTGAFGKPVKIELIAPK